MAAEVLPRRDADQLRLQLQRTKELCQQLRHVAKQQQQEIVKLREGQDGTARIEASPDHREDAALDPLQEEVLKCSALLEDLRRDAENLRQSQSRYAAQLAEGSTYFAADSQTEIEVGERAASRLGRETQAGDQIEPSDSEAVFVKKFFKLALRSSTRLWGQETACQVLSTLLDSTQRLLDRGRLSATVTLFIVDPSLCAQIGEPKSEGKNGASWNVPTANFTLRTKAEKPVFMKAFQRRPQMEAPIFKEFTSLPAQGPNNSWLALPLKAQSPSGSLLAVVQVKTERPLGASAKRDDLGLPGNAEEVGLGLTAIQCSSLRMLCTTVEGILNLRIEAELTDLATKRTRSCLDMVSELQAAPTLSEFEQRAARLFQKAFSALRARISFLDPLSGELLVRAAPLYGSQEDPKFEHNLGRRAVARISVREGLIGRCVRKETVYNIESVVSCAHINEQADGIVLQGQASEVSLMVGPMVAQLTEEDRRMVGAMQLFDKVVLPSASKKNHIPSDGTAGSRSKGKAGELAVGEAHPGRPFQRVAFSPEDEQLFKVLLRPLATIAYQVMVCQSGAKDGGEGHLLRIAEHFQS